jgi:hypothetical protein
MAPTRRTTRRGTRAAAILLLALAGTLAGCSAAEDAANDAAGAAQDRAKEEASDVARKAVEAQICALVGDGTVSAADVETLDTVLDRAHDLGLPADILDPAHEIVTAGKAGTAEIQQIRSNCS